jgi:hypothetical protein
MYMDLLEVKLQCGARLTFSTGLEYNMLVVLVSMFTTTSWKRLVSVYL